MTYNEGILHLETELTYIPEAQQNELNGCLESIANGTQTEKEAASEALADMYPLVEWLNSEMAKDAINAVYATVNPNAPTPKIRS